MALGVDGGISEVVIMPATTLAKTTNPFGGKPVNMCAPQIAGATSALQAIPPRNAKMLVDRSVLEVRPERTSS